MAKFSIVGEFKILQKLPSLNEVVAANRSGYHAGASLKKKLERDIMSYIEAAIYADKTLSASTIECPVCIYCRWHESTMRRDADNIESAVKFILDAMQKLRILKGDGRKYVPQVFHKIVDDDRDFVEVLLLRDLENGDKVKNKNKKTNTLQ